MNANTRAWTGNASAAGESFEELFERNRAWLLRLLVRLTRDVHEAEDLLQDTFLLAWRKADQFRGDGTPEGWLRRIAFRRFLNARVRRRRRPPTLLGEDAFGEPPAAESADVDPLDGARFDRARRAAELARVIEALPTVYRELLVLRCAGMTVTEIARVLRLTCKATELRIARGVRRAALSVTTPGASAPAPWRALRLPRRESSASSGTRPAA